MIYIVTYPTSSLLRSNQMLFIVSFGSLHYCHSSLRRQHVPQAVGSKNKTPV